MVKHKAFCRSIFNVERGMQIQILCLAVMSVLIVGVIPFAISAATASNSLNIFPPGGNPYGLSNSEHIKNFWKWILAIPAKDNPFNDNTGEKCALVSQI